MKEQEYQRVRDLPDWLRVQLLKVAELTPENTTHYYHTIAVAGEKIMAQVAVRDATEKPSANKQLFYELCKILGQGDSVKFTPARANKLRLRLKTFSQEEIKKVARTIAADEFMMGDNHGARKYGNIDYLIRNDEKMDEWLNNSVETSKVDLTKVKF